MRRLVAGMAAMVGLLAPTMAVTGASSAADRWAPADSARIHPGVQMYTKGAQCTGNFVFTDRRGRVYLGYAAHCAGTGDAMDTDGCLTGSHPLGTRVRFAEGGTLAGGGTTVGRGRLVYSSWIAMQQRGVIDTAACAFNDFALVRVAPRHVNRVNPSVPFWGGPTGLAEDGTSVGEAVYTYGSSSLRGGANTLSAKRGSTLGAHRSGWAYSVYTITPGVPGDSGSGFLDRDGRALGVLSTLGLTPLPAANGVGDLHRELEFAREHSGLRGLRLVPGTEPFAPLL